MIELKTKFITVQIFSLEPTDLPEFAREATLVMQGKASMRSGFVEGIVMVDESQRQALVVTQWESLHDWVTAEWDADIGRTLGDMVEGTKGFEFRSYEPITIVRA